MDSPLTAAAAAATAAAAAAVAAGGPGTYPYGGKRIEIRTVWADTLEAEFAHIRALAADRFRYVAMVRAPSRLPAAARSPSPRVRSRARAHNPTARASARERWHKRATARAPACPVRLPANLSARPA